MRVGRGHEKTPYSARVSSSHTAHGILFCLAINRVLILVEDPWPVQCGHKGGRVLEATFVKVGPVALQYQRLATHSVMSVGYNSRYYPHHQLQLGSTNACKMGGQWPGGLSWFQTKGNSVTLRPIT